MIIFNFSSILIADCILFVCNFPFLSYNFIGNFSRYFEMLGIYSQLTEHYTTVVFLSIPFCVHTYSTHMVNIELGTFQLWYPTTSMILLPSDKCYSDSWIL